LSKEVKVAEGSTATIGVVEGALIIEEDATVLAEDGVKVTVNGPVECKGNIVFNCSVEAERFQSREGYVRILGDLTVKDRVEVKHGSLEVSGYIKARAIDVEKLLKVGKDLTAVDVEVGDRLEIEGSTKVTKVEVGGTYTARGTVEAEDIDVGGSFKTLAAVKLATIDVGGMVHVSGGEVTGPIRVGGYLESTAPLCFNAIDVGGSIRLSAGSRGGDIHVGGSMKAEGDLRFKEIDVGGTVDISGTGEGENVDVGGRLQVGGDLRLTGKLNVGGTVDISGTCQGGEVDVGGRLQVGGDLRLVGRLDVGGAVRVVKELSSEDLDVGGSVEASLVSARNNVAVGGLIASEKGAKARRIDLGKRGEARGPLLAEEVHIRDRARVEDVYAMSLIMEENAKACNLYVGRASIESECRISGETQYLEALDTGRNVVFAKPPVKVEKLPQPPI